MKIITTRRPILSNKWAIQAREIWQRNNEWDSVPPFTKELPANIKYVVVDVKPHVWKKKSDNHQGRIVEIAWRVFCDEGNCLVSKQYLLKPHGYNQIAPKSTRVHGITTTLAVNHGSNANKVFDEFTAILAMLPNNGFVIAYRMLFEDSIFMCNLSEEQKIIWNNAPKCDIYSTTLWKYLPSEKMKMFKRQTHFPYKTFHLKLTDLHNIVFPSRKSCSDFAQMAGADVEMTWDVFKYYKVRASRAELQWKTHCTGAQTDIRRFTN